MPLDAIRRRRDVLLALRDLDRRRSESLAARDYDALIELLRERESLVERLAAQSRAAEAWPSVRLGLSSDDRAAGDAIWDEARSLLAELARREDDAIAELTRQRDATRDELKDVAAAGRVNTAYRDSLAPVTHRSLDVDR